MLIRSPADFSLSNPDLRARWGRESCIVWGRTRHVELAPCTHTLSIRCTWGGVEYCHVNGRTLAIDDDNFLVLNHGRIYSTSIRALQPVEMLAISFGPDLVEQLHDARAATVEQALQQEAAPRSLDFSESLQPHDRLVSPVLRFIRAHLLHGLTDEAWYEEQLSFLLCRLCTHHAQLQQQIDQLALARRSTRHEVHRRISLATDFLHTYYAQDVNLDAAAQIACMSKYHFLRLFTLVHGVTPHTYLQRKRASAASRLLESTCLPISEVAASVGYGEESTLIRQMRRWKQLTPGQIRAGAARSKAA